MSVTGMPLKFKNTPDDLLGLLILAKKNLKGIKITFRKHSIAQLEAEVEEIIGYYPAGTFQILFEKDGKTISCIRGAVSFGSYEIMRVEGFEKEREVSTYTEGPERYNNPKDVIRRIRILLN